MKKVTRYLCIILSLLMLIPAACAPKDEEWEYLVESPHPVEHNSTPPETDPSESEESENEQSPLFLSPEYCLASAKITERPPYPQIENYASSDDYYAAYEQWSKYNVTRNQNADLVKEATYDFSHQVTCQLLKTEEGENITCSPANLYMALAMLAEVTDNNTRSEILTLLGQSDTESLRTAANAVWDMMYTDGVTACIPANALFLRNDLSYKDETINTVAEQYHADLFHGKMGSKEYDAILQEWLNYQTRGLLEMEAGSIETEKESIMVLASTLYFSNKWDVSFQESDNFRAPFYGSKQEAETTYMKCSTTETYYEGERFDAVAKGFELGGSMWLIRPKEGASLEDILSDTEYLQMLQREDKTRFSSPIVNLSLPKFDVTASIDLTKELPKLGIHSALNRGSADFSPLTDEPCYLASAQHNTRVKIDEEGCEAAAFTTMGMNGSSAVEQQEIDFTLDHPFIFLIQHRNTILFVGIVQNL